MRHADQVVLLKPEPAMSALLQTINARHEMGFRLLGRVQGGENHGAYAIADPEGRQFILKRQAATPASESRIARAANVTERLTSLGYPAPRYLVVGTTPGGDLYSIQDALPGRPIDRLTELHQVNRVLELNDLQAGRAISAEQDWSAYATGVVFEDISGWAAALRAYSADTADLVTALEAITAGKVESCRANGDITHGDFSPGNVLVDRGQISGIVDWDAAGCGDRAFDLTLLLFYHYDDPRIRDRLRARVLELSGFDALCVYLAYTTLSQTTWSARHHGQTAVNHWLRLARQILDDLRHPSPGWI